MAVVEVLVDGRPGPDETWPELAEHSFTHDDVARPGWAVTGGPAVHWHLVSGTARAPGVRLKFGVVQGDGPLQLALAPCTARLLDGRWAGLCEAYAASQGWCPAISP
jgi:hypothetical protein